MNVTVLRPHPPEYCPRCKRRRAELTFNPSAVQGMWCRECQAWQARQYRRDNQERIREADRLRYPLRAERQKREARESRLRIRYGMSPAQWDELVEEQGGLCAICGRELALGTKSVHVDHDHNTGAVRGILCARCNLRLGAAEDADWLAKALAYLEYWLTSRAEGDGPGTWHWPTRVAE